MENLNASLEFGIDSLTGGIHKDELPSPSSYNNFVTDAIASDAQNKANQPVRVGMLIAHDRQIDNYMPANLMAYMAQQFNIELYFFKSIDVNLQDKTVNAILIKDNKKIHKIVPLFKIIYPINRGVLYKSSNKEITSLLTNECFLVNNFVNMDKQKCYDLLIADNRFKELLIETHLLENFDHFMELLRRYDNDVVIKSIKGSMGRGVIRITFDGKSNTSFIVFPKETLFLKTIGELKDYYEKVFAQEKYVLQPYIISRTKYDTPFDIRIHARRGAEGKFKIFIYPRIGRDPKGFLSNISTGGYTMPIIKFLQQEYGNEYKNVYDRLIQLGEIFPDYFQSFLPRRCFAMGIDIGIQRRGDLYNLKLFEVNTCDPGVTSIPVQAALTNLEYLQYLGRCLANGTLEKL